MDLRLLLVLSPIVASVVWTAFWLGRWGVFKFAPQDVLAGLKDAVDG